MPGPRRFYVTTPIYYVNDRPHIGHLYTTTLADVLARHHRHLGEETFFLTGTDEHAAKVVDSAAERGLSPEEWAARNAAEFQRAFARFGISNDDFIRTSEARHVERVTRYVAALLESGDVYSGDYEGWYDPGQEEYVPEGRAREWEYRSPVNGRPLVRRRERNYFFRLSAWRDALLDLIDARPDFVLPEARRNEVVGRLREGLLDVPISRCHEEAEPRWGIPMPGDPSHVIYVWIDALFNYLSAVDTEERRPFWPPSVHLIAKDILWFHAVIWPAMLLALRGCPGFDWVELPERVYAHSFWISEGQKMSKSLGNFVDLERLEGYASRFGLDALRFFLVTQGPLGTHDADFAEARFRHVYTAELANTLGNCANRVAHMTRRYLAGRAAAPEASCPAAAGLEEAAARAVEEAFRALEALAPDRACGAALELARAVNAAIEETRPFALARDPERRGEVGTILYRCAEALRIAALLLAPVMPERMAELLRRFGAAEAAERIRARERGDLRAWCRWGGLAPGTPLETGPALFPREEDA